MSRWFVSLPEATCIFSDVLAWPVRRDVGVERQRNNKLFLHSSYIPVPRSESAGPSAVRAVTKHRRHGRDRGETDSRATRDPIGEPMLVVTHERFSRRMTGRIPTCIVVHPSHRVCDTVSAYIILFVYPGQDEPRSRSDENERR